MTATPPDARPSRIEVDLSAVRHNVRLLRDHAPDAEFCAVVKADGYGHGAVPVARAALDAGATWLGVALIKEGEELRDAGIDVPILLLSEPPADRADRLLAADLTCPVYTSGMLRTLDGIGRDRGEPVPVHAKVDTGMGRVGVPAGDWPAFAAELADCDGVTVEGIWTHLARADEDVDTTDRQLARFDAALDTAREGGLSPRLVHASNSAATLRHPDAHHDLVRPGIALYGLSPASTLPAADLGLEPAGRLVSEVSYVKRVVAGTPASYGHTWQAPDDGWLATIPIGYADGVPRLLSNRVEVLIGGARRPIAGNVCMDQILAWCGGDEVAIGDEVVLLGRQGHETVAADEWAEAAGTITYEIATGWSARLPRLYVDGTER